MLIQYWHSLKSGIWVGLCSNSVSSQNNYLGVGLVLQAWFSLNVMILWNVFTFCGDCAICGN